MLKIFRKRALILRLPRSDRLNTTTATSSASPCETNQDKNILTATKFSECKIVNGATWLISHHKLPGKILDLSECDQTKPKIQMILVHEGPNSIPARIKNLLICRLWKWVSGLKWRTSSPVATLQTCRETKVGHKF